MSERKFSTTDAAYAAGFREGVEHVEREERAGVSRSTPGAPPTLDEIKRMSADEINARWDEILPVLEGGHDK